MIESVGSAHVGYNENNTEYLKNFSMRSMRNLELGCYTWG